MIQKDEDNTDEEYDPDKIASVRKWLNEEADKLALSNPNCAFLHSSLLNDPEPLSEYDTDLSDLDELGPF